MKHITIIVPVAQSSLSTIACLAGAYEIFTAANTYRKKSESYKTGTRELFTIELAGISEKEEINGGMFTVKPQVSISAITKTNLIIIPSTTIRDYKDSVKGNQELINWIEQQYK